MNEVAVIPKKMTGNAFSMTLQEIRGGDCLTELSEKLVALVARVRLTGKSGDMTLKIKIKPAGRGVIGTLILEDKVKVNLPELEVAQSFFFATDQNTLQRNDPNQREMNFRTVEGEKVEVEKYREVAS